MVFLVSQNNVVKIPFTRMEEMCVNVLFTEFQVNHK